MNQPDLFSDGALTTAVEAEELARCETVIARGLKTFIEVGEALTTIRDSRLYRQSHPTFDAYCKERWGWTAGRARQLIGAAETATNVAIAGGTAPATESQARELAGLTPAQAAIVMRVAAESGAVTAAAIKAARRQPWTTAEITVAIDGYQIHPMLAVLPAFRAGEWEPFVASVGRLGLIRPILISADGSTIIDGRFRYLALRWNGIDPDSALAGPGDEPALKRLDHHENYVSRIYSENVIRQHLSDDQKAMIRVELAEAVAE